MKNMFDPFYPVLLRAGFQPTTANTMAAAGDWNHCRLITAGIDTLDLGWLDAIRSLQIPRYVVCDPLTS